MFTIDRLNLLRDHYGLSPLQPSRLCTTTDPKTHKVVNPYPVHHFIDVLDTKANLKTTRLGGGLAYVGERLCFHERWAFNKCQCPNHSCWYRGPKPRGSYKPYGYNPPPRGVQYFWLGAEGAPTR